MLIIDKDIHWKRDTMEIYLYRDRVEIVVDGGFLYSGIDVEPCRSRTSTLSP